jgi:hypothetical protein
MSRLVVTLVLLLSALDVIGQSQPASDPQALSYAAQSIAAITRGTSIRDVTLTGNVTWNGPAADSGTATFLALGTGESRMDLALAAGTRTEIRDAQTGVAHGQWINPENKSRAFAVQNCQTDAVWFFPALGSLAAAPNIVLSYVGQETWKGREVQHIRSYISSEAPNIPGTTAKQLSTMDFYLDAVTLLPVSTTFNAYPDHSLSTRLPIEIEFSNFQRMDGVLVPTSIEKYLQGNLLMKVEISSASFNSGLSLSSFTIEK